MMRFLVTLFVVALSTPFISAAGNIGDTCCVSNLCSEQITCNEGLSCCEQRPVWQAYLGGTCHDPKTSSCASCPVYNPNHPQTQVCPNSAPTCCGGCIDNSKQCCHHYGSYDFFTCNADQICCGFDNGERTCCNSDQLCINDKCVAPPTCPQGTSACGTSCYQSTDYVCADPSKSILCPVSFPKLCEDACYSESEYTCVNGALQPVGGNPTTEPSTGPTREPTTGPTSSTPAPGCVMPGDLVCGARCYSPKTHVCAAESSSFLCPIDFPSACGAACYSSTQYKCVNGHLQPL